MRLTPEQQYLIRQLVHEHLDERASVTVFGSRVDDAAIGGDIDLLIELPEKAPLTREIALSARLEQHLGVPIDLITTFPGQKSRPIVELARMTGVLL